MSLGRYVAATRDVLFGAVLTTIAAMPAGAQGPEAATTPEAPAVQRWGDSVSLRTFGLALRLPADGVRWQERRNAQSTTGAYDLVGEVDGVRERVTLTAWNNPGMSTCEGWVTVQRGRFARYRQLGMRVPDEVVTESPTWLPRGSGWSTTVWMGNACRDGAQQPLVITVSLNADADARAVEATRTMLWYLGEAATRAGR